MIRRLSTERRRQPILIIPGTTRDIMRAWVWRGAPPSGGVLTGAVAGVIAIGTTMVTSTSTTKTISIITTSMAAIATRSTTAQRAVAARVVTAGITIRTIAATRLTTAVVRT